MNKKFAPIRVKKWRHARISIEIVWKNEQKADLQWLWKQMS